MKIFNFGLEIDPGKYKYKDPNFEKLVEKFQPEKETPYSVEFMNEDVEKCEAVVYDTEKRLDLVFMDLEKIETRLTRTEDEAEKALLIKAQKLLESEKLVCDCEFSDDERETFRLLQFVTVKPCKAFEKSSDRDEVIREIIHKSDILIYFTAGKKEVHAWDIKKGEEILEAAGKIHSDLKRGFIKGDVVNARELDNFFNMNEARAKGFVKTVDRDYVVEENDIIEIKFNV